MDTAGVTDEKKADEQYMRCLLDLVSAYGTLEFANRPKSSPYRTVFHVLALDGIYDSDGDLDTSSFFYVSNPYVIGLVTCLNNKLKSSGGFVNNAFEAVGSVNPLQARPDGPGYVMRNKQDWLREIVFLQRNGVRWIKWRPASSHLDPALVSDEFYEETKGPRHRNSHSYG